MKNKELIQKTMNNIEQCFIEETTKLAMALERNNIGFRELYDLRSDFFKGHFPNISTELFERINENLLYIKLGE